MEQSDPDTHPVRGAPRRGLRLAIWLGAGLAVLVALGFFGIALPLDPFQSAIESRASDALGRDVRVGSLGFVLGVHPRLEVEHLQLAHVLKDRPDVLRVDRLELEIGLIPFLRRRLHVRRARIEGVAVRVDPEAFPESPDEASTGEDPGAGASILESWSLDVDELALADVGLELQRPDLEPLQASLAQLSGRLRWDDSVELAFSGRYRDLPVSARIEGAAMGRLIEGAEEWPLHLAADLVGSPIEFAARLATAGGVYRIDDLQGRVGTTRVSGWLALENLVTKPRASGRIEVGAVTLELPERVKAGRLGTTTTESTTSPPVVEAEAVEIVTADDLAADDPAADDPEAGPGPADLVMDMLRDFETDLEIDVERISGVGPIVEDLSVALRVSGGELLFPVSLSADGIPMAGTLRVKEVEGLPHLDFDLAAEHFRVDELAARLFPDVKVTGPFEKLRLELEGRGRSLLSFLETLRVDLRMTDAALRYGDEQPVPFGVTSLELVVLEGLPLRLNVRGDLLGEQVGLDLSAGDVATLLGVEPWALEFEARGSGATIALTGTATGALDELDLLGDLRIHGERLSRLEPWLGKLPVPDASYAIRARIDDRPNGTRVELQEVRLGEANVVGELGARRGEDDPLLWATLRIESLDLSPWVEALRSARGVAAEATAEEEESGIELDAPILPGGLAIRDADFDLAVGKLVAGDLDVGDLRFRGGFRDGFLPESEFGFRLGAAAFVGTTTVDLREPPHAATFTFGTQKVDVGRLLSHLGLAKGVDARAGSLRIEVKGSGATLGELLREMDFMARLEDLRWTLRDPNAKAGLDVVLDRGVLTSPRGDEPIRLDANGSLKGVPVQLSLQTEQLSFFSTPDEQVSIDLRVEMAGATLEVAAGVSLPIERSELDLSLTLAGRSMAGASSLFDYDLPPIGPYRLTSRMRLTPQDYRLSEFGLHVGQSRLRGSGRLDLRGARPRIDLELASERVQIDDFAAAFEAPDEAAPARTVASRYEDLEGVREFWSPEGLLGFDGRLVAQADRVLSGKDELGRGRLDVRLENGRLSLDPLHLELPGGPFDLRTDYAFVAKGAGSGIEARIRANTERLDYGPLARRVDPETEMAGWISLDLDITGQAPETRALLAHSNGKFDFLVRPENFDADVFDLWALSLLRFIVPRLDPTPRSTLNCVVARFEVDDGILDEKALYLDTTSMSVEGDARVDFREERFRATLTPQPKKAELMSLQTRVRVHGGFDDFQVGVPPEELFATVLRFATSVVVVPFRRLFEEPPSPDGEEACRAAWQVGRE